MIVEYIRYTIAADDSAAFEAAWAEAVKFLDDDAGCLGYELTRCEEDPRLYIMRIEWTSTEAHMRGFRKGANFGAFFVLIRPYLRAVQEMQHYAPTVVCSTPAA